MRVLISEDDPISRRVLQASLVNWGYEVIVTGDGLEALLVIQKQQQPLLAILDVMMPGMTGFEVCESVRAGDYVVPPYLILLTTRNSKADLRAGFAAGADDYLAKPFDANELLARIRVGERMLELQNKLAEKVRQLEESTVQVKQLQGILPICGYCKKIRDDQNYWQAVESYISKHTEAQFSHSICPGCYKDVVEPQLDEMTKQQH